MHFYLFFFCFGSNYVLYCKYLFIYKNKIIHSKHCTSNRIHHFFPLLYMSSLQYILESAKKKKNTKGIQRGKTMKQNKNIIISITNVENSSCFFFVLSFLLSLVSSFFFLLLRTNFAVIFVAMSEFQIKNKLARILLALSISGTKSFKVFTLIHVQIFILFLHT